MDSHAPSGTSPRRILALWAPLAASSMLMSAEMPFVNAGIARTPNPEAALAGFGIAVNLAIMTEAPILMLNGAAAALARDRAHFRLLERFTLQLGLFVTAAHFLLAFTPLYDAVLRQWMGVPDAVADACLPALRILLIWPAPIGWRRFHQGFLIRMRRTAVISLGTIIRLVITVLLTLVTISVLRLPGQSAGAASVVTAVIIESALITYWARKLLPDLDESTGTPMRPGQLFNFYLPLIMVSVMSILAQPIISTGLARAPFPTQSLAAWPTLWGLTSLVASVCQPLQETTITFAERHAALGGIRRFGLVLGGGASVFLALLALTPLADAYFGRLIGLSESLRAFTNPALVPLIPFPLLMACEMMLRGFLIKQQRTSAPRLAMAFYVVILAGVLLAGVALQFGTGVQIAALAVLAAITGEVGLLAWQALPLVRAMRHGMVQA